MNSCAAVELLVVTMQPFHKKWAKHPGRSTSFDLKFQGDVLGVSAHSMVFGTAEFIIFLRSYSVFPVLKRSNFFIFFFKQKTAYEI